MFSFPAPGQIARPQFLYNQLPLNAAPCVNFNLNAQMITPACQQAGQTRLPAQTTRDSIPEVNTVAGDRASPGLSAVTSSQFRELRQSFEEARALSVA